METTIRSTRPITHYWDKVKGMDDSMKLELVTMLINSVRLHPTTTKKNEDERERGFRSLAGCWLNDKDNDDVEAIIRQGRQGRSANRFISSFDK